MQAGQFVQVVEKRQGLKIACLEEIGYRNGWLGIEQLVAHAERLTEDTLREVSSRK